MTELGAPDAGQVMLPSHMRALVLDGVGWAHLHVVRVPLPRPGPDQVLARVDAAGICTSLLKLIAQGPDHNLVYGWDLSRWPLILGDEGAVTLVEVGEALRGEYHVGTRHAVQPAVEHSPINHPERYRDGGRGIAKIAAGYTLPGFLAEYVLIPEEVLLAGCLLPVPDPTMAYAHVAVSEPLSCVVSAQDHHLHLTREGAMTPRSVIKGLRPGGVVVVIGAGAMGRMHVEVAMSHRPSVIVCADVIEDRLDLVRRLFAARAEGAGILLRTVNAGREELRDVVADLTDHRGADDVIVAVGSAGAIAAAMGYIGRGAVLNLFGGLQKGQEMVGLDTGIIHYREINVTGSSGGYAWDILRTLEMMAEGSINAAPHITRIGDLEHAPELLQMVQAQQIDGKAVVYPHRRTETIRAVPAWTAADERAYMQDVGR
jgi:threonine dehydrogenase-like Zn-dependent dehydrogenase